MSVETALWKIDQRPEKLIPAVLQSEQLLEDMIVSRPELLSDEWMLIGRQEDTGYRGRIDLLAIAPDASLVLIELKHEQTPREVITQALDYAAWVETLQVEAIQAIYARFRQGGRLADDFAAFHHVMLDEAAVNQSHQIVIVAASLDSSTERILNYLNAREVAINVLFFQVFALGEERILSRSWLVDPSETQANVVASVGSEGEPWNGEYYCSFGEDRDRSWEDAVKSGFFCAGGGQWYTRTLQLLKPGDRIWVKIPSRGFVGVGIVAGRATAAREVVVPTSDGDQFILDAPTKGTYLELWKDDLQKCEYFVPIRWLDTVPSSNPVNETGFFGNQHSVCAPRASKWRSTVERLKTLFPHWQEE